MKLSSRQTEKILSYLGCAREMPTVRYLNRLIHAYVRRVPWESVSRVIKRYQTTDTKSCPRWPDEFWEEALEYGTGGTCFEGNLAFFTFLSELGFEGYLTINDMEKPACHTASIIRLNGHKYLADVAIPVHCALPIHPRRLTRRSNEFHHYLVRPQGNDRYAIERSHHPKRRAFTLADRAIPQAEYCEALQKDYGETGYFLDRVIIVKVIEGRLWRFSSADLPYKLEGFDKTSRQEVSLRKDELAKAIAQCFEMDESKVALALSYKGVI